MNGKTETTSRNDIGIELRKDGEDSSSSKPHIRFQEKEYHVKELLLASLLFKIL